MKIRRLLFAVILCLLVKTNTVFAMPLANALYLYAADGNVDAVEDLLNRGYSIDLPNADGETALCLAVKARNKKAYWVLRDLGADYADPCVVQEVRNYKSNPEATIKNDDNTWLYAAGALAVGGAAAIALSSSGGGHSSDNNSQVVTPERPVLPDINFNPNCPDGFVWSEKGCVAVNTSCPNGWEWDGYTCVEIGKCPLGQEWDGSQCKQIVCDEGLVLIGNECVAQNVCPENMHLQGNNCVADGDVVVSNGNDSDVYGIYSENIDVFNLLSTPTYAKSNASVVLNNEGKGKVVGVYGLGNIFNSYMAKYSNEKVNPLELGVGNVIIRNQGPGDVYGLFSRVADVHNLREAMNVCSEYNGVAYGNIDITHMGGGSTFGVFGDVRAYNVYSSMGGSGYGDITIRADGNIYGVSGYAAATNAVSPFYAHEAIGKINLHSLGNGNVYGMLVSKDNIPGVGQPNGGNKLATWFAFNAYSSGGDNVEGSINIRNLGNGNVYGMYGGRELYNAMAYGGVNEETGIPNGHAKGKINIVNYGNGDVYGMYLPDEDASALVSNVSANGSESTISIVNTGDGVATGLRGGKKVNIVNSGNIYINNMGNGTAIGIFGEENSQITNSGNINIIREEYVDKEDNVLHSPTSTRGGTAYGIYAQTGSYVNNTGNIIIQNANAGTGIYLERGATFENNGVVSFNGANNSIVTNGNRVYIYDGKDSHVDVNMGSMGEGEIVLGEHGKFFADSLSGKMGVSEKVVTGSMNDEYVLEGALQASNVRDLSLASKSVMFDVKASQNSESGYDVVLERQSFDKLLDDKNIAQYLEENYNAKNGEKIFDNLKEANSVARLNEQAANLTGTDILPNFQREDTYVYRNINRQFNDNLFNKPEENYVGGYKYIDISSDKDGLLEGSDAYANVAYGMLKNKTDDGVVYGLGASVAQLKSDYDNGSNRKNNMFGLWAPVGYDFNNGARWYSKLYAGYSDGSYNRVTDTNKFSSDFNEYQYGLSNEVRYSIRLGNGFIFDPLAELNFLGIYQDGYDEGSADEALKADSSNSMSLEGGLGAYLTKEILFNDDNKLGIQIGGVYYVEFLDSDDEITASLNGMGGKYKITHGRDSSRAVLSARVNYNYKDVTVYGNIEKETSGNEALVIDAGVQYKF